MLEVLSRLVVVLAFAATPQLTACDGTAVPRSAEAEVEQRTQPMTQAAVERAIPLRFLKMYAAGGLTDAALYANLRLSVDRANDVYKAAGVQFFIAGLLDCPTIRGAAWRDTYADIRNDDYSVTPPIIYPNGNLSITYAVARDDLLCAYPDLPSTVPITGSKREQWWMDYVAMLANRPYEIPVFLHSAGGHYSKLPWSGRGVHYSVAGGWESGKLGHELGHHLGLIHTFEDAVVVPYMVDPSTDAIFNRWDFWDLYFQPAVNPGDQHQFFSSAALMLAAGGPYTTINTHDGTTNNCTSDGSWRLTCVINQGPVPSVSYTHPTNDPNRNLKGLGFTCGSASHGANAMGYGGPEDCRGLSDSQVQAVRKFLRFETKVMPTQPGWPSNDGGRTKLGRYLNREPAYKLDFDGDGLRDIAWWVPPTTSAGTGEFTILLSTTSYASPFTVSFGRLGETPVPADYDGDGRTDLALYQSGGGAAGSSPFDNLSHWRWCSSPNPPTSTMCSAPTPSVAQFGSREDVPLPGLDFDGLATTGHLAFYRPSVGLWVWGSATVPPTVQGTKLLGNARSVPLPGLYDTDTRTDLVVYHPDTALFEMRMATSSWNTTISRQFPSSLAASDPDGSTAADRAGAVPVRGMAKRVYTGMVPCGMFQCPRYEPRLALSLWSPNDGMWHTMWSPVTSSNRIWCQAWGTNDVPLAGTGLDHRPSTVGTAYSRLTVFSASDFNGPGSFFSRPSAESSCPAQDLSVYLNQVNPKSMVFVVADMKTTGAPLGDGKPEIATIDPNTMTIKILRSDSGYTSFFVVSVATPTNHFVLL